MVKVILNKVDNMWIKREHRKRYDNKVKRRQKESKMGSNGTLPAAFSSPAL